MSLNSMRPTVIVFDVDGTLYYQAPVRRAMLLRLLWAAVPQPLAGWRMFRTLHAYRAAQEHLRGRLAGDAESEQIRFVCERTGRDRASVVACVERWMEQEPLSVLPRCIHRGLPEFLGACKARGLRLAAVSDYPADAKLRALGIADLFDLVLSAQTPEVGVFKPHPRGLLLAAERLDADVRECLYVGDRAEVDAAAAEAAGMPCVILTRKKPDASQTYQTVSGYPALQQRLFGPRHTAVGGVLSPESHR